MPSAWPGRRGAEAWGAHSTKPVGSIENPAAWTLLSRPGERGDDAIHPRAGSEGSVRVHGYRADGPGPRLTRSGGGGRGDPSHRERLPVPEQGDPAADRGGLLRDRPAVLLP